MSKFVNKKKLRKILEATVSNCDMIIANSDKLFRQAYYRGQKELCKQLLEDLQ